MATADDYANWIVQNADKKGTPAFQTVAAAYQDAKNGGDAAKQQRIDAQVASDRAQYNPTNDMSTTDRTLAGIGSGMTSVLRAVGGGSLADKLGLPATAQDAAQTDAPLMATTAGKVGKVIGQAAPSMLAIPAAPAGAIGMIGGSALAGGLTTEGGLTDRAIGAGAGALGGAAGAIIPAVPGVARGLYRAVTEPLYNSGRQRIAGRAIQQFATDPAALAAANGAPTVTGSVPTLAEATRDPGIATLQRALGTMDPDSAAAFAARGQANNASRLDTLQTIAAPGDAARAARAAGAKTNYGAAMDAGIDPDVAASMQPQIQQLLSRPSIKSAQAEAQSLAAEQGLNVGDNTSVQGLHYLKMALDDQIAKAVPGSNAQRALVGTAKDLSDTLEQLSPGYQQARAQYAKDSIPVNQADIGQRLVDKTTGAIRDFSGNQTLQANKFSGALNDEAALLKNSTGMTNKSQLNQLMTPDQMQKIGGVRDELETLSNLNNAANGAGSQTAKMLASQNMLKQIAGPLGLPDGVVSNVVTQNLQRIPNFVGYKAADPLIQQQLTEALLNPAKALDFLAKARAADMPLPKSQLAQLLKRASPALANAGSPRSANGAN